MATSGSIAGSFSGSGSAGQKPYIFWERTSYSVEDNTSTIKITLKVKRIGTSYYTSKSDAPYTLKIGSNTKSGTKDYKLTSVSSGSYLTIASYTKTVAHDSDGTLTDLSLKATLNLSGTTAGTGTVSGTIDLPTIPRKSSATIASSSVTTGSSVKISITRKSSSFTHKASYTLNGVSGTFTSGLSATSGIGTSFTFTPPHSLFKKLTTSTSVKATITITTMYGSTIIGSTTVTVTIKLHSSAKPVISSLALTRVAGNSATEDWGVYIQGYDKVKAVATAAMNSDYDCGGTVSTAITIGSSTTKSASVTSGVLGTAGDVTITATATDSRGRSATVTQTINVVAYSKPIISIFKAFRAVSDSATSGSSTGAYARMLGNWSFSSVSGKNAVTAKLSITPQGGTETVVSNAAEVNTYYTASGLVSASSYTVNLTVTDSLGNSVSANILILSEYKAMSFAANGRGIAFGKVAEDDDYLDVNFMMRLRKSLEIDGDLIVNNSSLESAYTLLQAI